MQLNETDEDPTVLKCFRPFGPHPRVFTLPTFQCDSSTKTTVYPALMKSPNSSLRLIRRSLLDSLLAAGPRFVTCVKERGPMSTSFMISALWTYLPIVENETSGRRSSFLPTASMFAVMIAFWVCLRELLLVQSSEAINGDAGSELMFSASFPRRCDILSRMHVLDQPLGCSWTQTCFVLVLSDGL